MWNASRGFYSLCYYYGYTYHLYCLKQQFIHDYCRSSHQNTQNREEKTHLIFLEWSHCVWCSVIPWWEEGKRKIQRFIFGTKHVRGSILTWHWNCSKTRVLCLNSVTPLNPTLNTHTHTHLETHTNTEPAWYRWHMNSWPGQTYKNPT